ncbi:MAG: hypothetical protein KatS3mg011_1050 [Acidimicrobiia bacterium]|nr:MAG: hypothetical protein KatS3mg011_1050 [Acidimicrobiia bacterium]
MAKVTRNRSRKFPTASSTSTNAARPKSATTMVRFRSHRSATTPPRIPNTSPGRIRATSGTRIATDADRPPPAMRAARANVANRVTQSPRLEMAWDHHSRA